MLTPSGGHQRGWYASYWNVFLLPSTNKVCEGYVFTCVCHSVHRGVCLSAWWDTIAPPRDQAPPSRAEPPGQGTSGLGTPLGADSPSWNQAPPWEHTPLRPPPPPICAVHAGRYGQQAGGMKPTGMQSC